MRAGLASRLRNHAGSLARSLTSGDNRGMENDLVRWLHSYARGHKRLVLGLGDDAAVLELAAGQHLVATTDMLMDGVDFRVGEHRATDIGYKALAVNLSDLAAMAARPLAALVSLALPRQGGEALAKDLYDGMAPLLLAHDMALAGGDTNSWDGPLVISVTALGHVSPGKEWRRSGARPGDAIVVTGRFGGSLLGRHLAPEPRVEEALWLVENAEVHAAIDVSDGLSLDLSRVAEESKCGAVLELDTIPIAQAARELATREPLPGTALDHALSDGEDFELILAMPAEEAERLVRLQPFETPLSIVGRFVQQPGLWASDPSGKLQPLAARGWEHRLEP